MYFEMSLLSPCRSITQFSSRVYNSKYKRYNNNHSIKHINPTEEKVSPEKKKKKKKKKKKNRNKFYKEIKSNKYTKHVYIWCCSIKKSPGMCVKDALSFTGQRDGAEGLTG